MCKRQINNGTERQKRVEVRQKPGEDKKYFGIGAMDGPLIAAEGPIVGVMHSKCFHTGAKREMRGGDTLSGRTMGAGLPTAYEVGEQALNRTDLEERGLTIEDVAGAQTRALQERANMIRQWAVEMGTASGGHELKERIRAYDHDGPYDHDHRKQLELWRLPAHMHYAHGVDGVAADKVGKDAHDAKHAILERARIEAHRKADPGYREPGESDWRDQDVMEVAEVAAAAKPKTESEMW